MQARVMLRVSGTVFALVALLHLARLLAHTPARLGGWDVPLAVSAAGVLVAGLLAALDFAAARRHPGTRS